MKPKIYLSKCAIKEENQKPIIVITHNECIFSTNDKVYKVWTQKKDAFLQPKSQKQGIMTLNFILPYRQLNMNFLNPKRRKEIALTLALLEIEVVEIFEYKKNNDRYLDEAKLHQQVVNKTLPIAEAFYPRYSLFYLTDNTTCHFIYAKNML